MQALEKLRGTNEVTSVCASAHQGTVSNEADKVANETTKRIPSVQIAGIPLCCRQRSHQNQVSIMKGTPAQVEGL
jgi:hypothetical protein